MEYGGYKIVGDKTFGMYSIKPIGKGSVSKDMLGVYTSPAFAMKVIDSKNKKKEVVNGKDSNNR